MRGIQTHDVLTPQLRATANGWTLDMIMFLLRVLLIVMDIYINMGIDFDCYS
jgi:hypothetical protein